MTVRKFNLVIIGAGPAGMSAAITATKAGLSVLILDDQGDAGGQVYRRLAQTLQSPPVYLGAAYAAGIPLMQAFLANGGVYEPKSTVWQITEDRDVAIVRNGQAEVIGADYIIIATGAIERAMPVTGWTLPGVMTVGGAQTLLKQAAIGAEDAVFVGSGPLLYLTAWQYIRAGLRVRAVLDTTGTHQKRAAIIHAPMALLQPAMLASGLAWMREIRRQSRLVRNVGAVEIIGQNRARAVRYETAGGHGETIDADHVFLHQGVIPNINLTMATGLDHHWDDVGYCWRPVTDGDGQSSDPHVYVAGDGGGVGGAKAAALAGRIAATAIIRRAVPSTSRQRGGWRDHVRLWHQRSIRPFLDRLYTPSSHFRLPQSDGTIVCRCESVTHADVKAALGDAVTGPNQLKAFCRAGMGRCQGRGCGLLVQEMIAAHHRQSMAQTGYYRLRPPVKPVTLAELASLDGPWPG